MKLEIEHQQRKSKKPKPGALKGPIKLINLRKKDSTKSYPTLATPWTAAFQASLSIEFSRQEYCSGLPHPPPGDLPNPRIKPMPPALQADSLLSEPPGKSKNTGVGSLSLPQGIFPNQGLLHCRQMLYPLSYVVSPDKSIPRLKIIFYIKDRKDKKRKRNILLISDMRERPSLLIT